MASGSLDAHGDRDMLVPGTPVAHYRIIEQIGRGGMGTVYLAHDTLLDRKVALKFLHRGVERDAEARQRLLREARAASRLDHPHIVSIHAIEQRAGRHFIVMEFIEGRSLAEVIRDGTMSLERAHALMEQILDGVGAAHSAGVIHRDLKTDNIRVTASGDVKIMDFGLAGCGGEAEPEDTEGTGGTPAYMSPEQALGKPTDVRSDVFSLGVLLYELLTGVRPFRGRYEAELAYAVVNTDPAALAEHRPGIPAALQQVVTRALQKDPSRRYPGAAEMADDLRRALAPVSSPRSRRRRAIVWALAAAAMLALAAGLYSFVPGRQTGGPRPMVAVLPLVNLGAETDVYFAQGMTAELTTRLAYVPELGVIDRASAQRYAEAPEGTREIGTELGVDYLLSGTIRRETSESESRVSVQLQLIRVSDDKPVWSDNYVRVLADIFDLQTEIAQDVVRKLTGVLAEGGRLVMRPTDDLAAYEFFLRGESFFNRSWREEDIRRAVEMYDHAVALDSTFALAWAMLARAHASMFLEYYDRSDACREAARRASERAVELRPDLVETHLARGYYFYHCQRNYEEALAEFMLGMQIQPEHADLQNGIAAVQRRLGRLPEAVESFREAFRLDPRSHLKAFDIALTYGMLRERDSTLTYLDYAIALKPDEPLGYVYKAWLHIIEAGDIEAARRVLEEAQQVAHLRESEYYWWLVRIIYPDYGAHLDRRPTEGDPSAYYIYQGRLYHLQNAAAAQTAYYDSARILLEARVVEQKDAARYWSWLGQAYAGLGWTAQAQAAGDSAMKLLPVSRDAFDAPFLIVNLAESLVMIGDYEAATDQLERLLAMPGFVSVPYLKIDPLWRPLRGSPRFEALIADSTPS